MIDFLNIPSEIDLRGMPKYFIKWEVNIVIDWGNGLVPSDNKQIVCINVDPVLRHYQVATMG